MLEKIFDQTNGYCYYCGKEIVFRNYGLCEGYRPLARGAWEVDHRRPLSKGGSNSIRNLVPACCECNRDKSNQYPY